MMCNPSHEVTIEDHWGCQVLTWLAVLRKIDTPSPLALFDMPELQPLMALWDTSPHTMLRG